MVGEGEEILFAFFDVYSIGALAYEITGMSVDMRIASSPCRCECTSKTCKCTSPGG